MFLDLNTVTLYGRWRPFGFEDAFAAKGKVQQSGYYKMQDMTPEICNLIKEPSDNSTTRLIDTRDSTVYNVAKLKDGRCWMTSNLNLVGSRTLTSADSNVTSNWTLPASSNSNWGYNYSAYIHRSNNASYVGTYYTWNAATAGTGTSSLSNGVNASSSVCPKGWRLPRGGKTSSTNEFMVLNDAYGGGTDAVATARLLQPATPNFQLNGEYLNGSEGGQGSVGRYWSSTSYGVFNGNYDAYNPAFRSTELLFANLSAMYRGIMIRCIAIN